MNILTRYPLRVVIPLVVLLFAVAVSAALSLHNLSEMNSSIEKKIFNRVITMMNHMQGTLRNLSRRGDRVGMNMEVSQLGADVSVDVAIFVDDSDKVLFATRYALVGKDARAVDIDIPIDDFGAVRTSMQAKTRMENGRNSVLAMYPVELWENDGGLGPSGVGVLFMRYDLADEKQDARRLVWQQALQFTVIVLLFSLLLLAVLHAILSRRAAALVACAERFSGGDTRARASLSGNDELAVVGRALDNMIQAIVSERQRLQESEQHTRAILDSVVEGILTLDSRGDIETFNPGAELIFGYTGDEARGLAIAQLLDIDGAGGMEEFLDAGDHRRDVKLMHGRCKDGRKLVVEIALARTSIEGELVHIILVRDVTEREKVDRIKREFVSVVSHELRTPLTSIMGALGLLVGQGTEGLPEPKRNLLDIALSNCKRLERLVNDILDVERIESGQLRFDEEEVALDGVIETSVRENQGYATRLGVRLRVTGSLPAIKVSGDGGRLMQAMDNLLSNAAKFSSAGSCVDISMLEQGAYVEVRVQDYGIGIPDAVREQIFSKFVQVDSSDTRQKGGTGLGLCIFKGIIERHQGSVGFSSESDAGSVFWFRLPIRRSRASTACA